MALACDLQRWINFPTGGNRGLLGVTTGLLGVLHCNIPFAFID